VAGARAYECVYCHDLDRSHAINDVTKKKKVNKSCLARDFIELPKTAVHPVDSRPSSPPPHQDWTACRPKKKRTGRCRTLRSASLCQHDVPSALSLHGTIRTYFALHQPLHRTIRKDLAIDPES